MKNVLVIEESPLLREYLRLKLTENGLDASVAINGLDGITKIRSIVPDLIVLDYHLTRQTCLEVLEDKRRNPNTTAIPVIVTAQKLDQQKMLELVKYNVKKVFTKPIKIDAFFASLSEILDMEFTLDKTPSIVEAHVNDDIIFVEIAQGLNREKLDLLRFKIAELMDVYDIRTPKVLVMLSDLKLGFGDGPNLQKLLDTITTASRARQRNIKIITNDTFVGEFVRGQKAFADIEVVSNLQFAMDGLLAELDPGMEFGDKKAEIIGNRILSATGNSTESESVQLKFAGEMKKPVSVTDIKDLGKKLKIAAVDDDFVIQTLIKTSFSDIDAEVTTYNNGEEFLAVAGKTELDLVFLDLLMPKVSGFEVLQNLKSRDIRLPIIVLSAVTQREAVIKAFQYGVKSYLVKPLQPEDIFKKAVEILKSNF